MRSPRAKMLSFNSVGSGYTKEKQILIQAGTDGNMGTFEFDTGKTDERKYI